MEDSLQTPDAREIESQSRSYETFRKSSYQILRGSNYGNHISFHYQRTRPYYDLPRVDPKYWIRFEPRRYKIV